MHIGEKVLQLRTKRRLTQQELADRAGISQPVICRLEKDVRANVNADVLKRLAEVLGCTTDYLVGMYEKDTGSKAPLRRRKAVPVD
jgi:transcriptional regulator with XRE-family HTH domain